MTTSRAGAAIPRQMKGEIKMKKFDYEKQWHKALNAGVKMLDHANRLDKMADKNPDLEKAIQQRCVANILRDYYKEMFN